MANDYKKSITISVKGIYYVEDSVPMIEIEEVGCIPLTKVFESLQDENVSLSVKVVSELAPQEEE